MREQRKHTITVLVTSCDLCQRETQDLYRCDVCGQEACSACCVCFFPALVFELHSCNRCRQQGAAAVKQLQVLGHEINAVLQAWRDVAAPAPVATVEETPCTPQP